MVAHGTRDPICCPTVPLRGGYKFTENKLVALLGSIAAPTEPAASAQTTLTPRPRATATTLLKPPTPKGFIAYHFCRSGIDRVAMINLETKQILPLFDVGPVLDLTETRRLDAGVVAGQFQDRIRCDSFAWQLEFAQAL